MSRSPARYAGGIAGCLRDQTLAAVDGEHRETSEILLQWPAGAALRALNTSGTLHWRAEGDPREPHELDQWWACVPDALLQSGGVRLPALACPLTASACALPPPSAFPALRRGPRQLVLDHHPGGYLLRPRARPAAPAHRQRCAVRRQQRGGRRRQRRRQQRRRRLRRLRWVRLGGRAGRWRASGRAAGRRRPVRLERELGWRRGQTRSAPEVQRRPSCQAAAAASAAADARAACRILRQAALALDRLGPAALARYLGPARKGKRASPASDGALQRASSALGQAAMVGMPAKLAQEWACVLLTLDVTRPPASFSGSRPPCAARRETATRTASERRPRWQPRLSLPLWPLSGSPPLPRVRRLAARRRRQPAQRRQERQAGLPRRRRWCGAAGAAISRVGELPQRPKFRWPLTMMTGARTGDGGSAA